MLFLAILTPIWSMAQTPIVFDDICDGSTFPIGDMNVNDDQDFYWQANIINSGYELTVLMNSITGNEYICASTDFVIRVYGPFAFCEVGLNSSEILNEENLAYYHTITLETDEIINDEAMQIEVFSLGVLTDQQLLPGTYYIHLSIENIIGPCFNDNGNKIDFVAYSENMSCNEADLQLETSNFYSSCDNYYSICGSSANSSGELNFNLPPGENEIWLGTILSANSNMTLTINTDEQMEGCSTYEGFEFELFGPFNQCQSACNSIGIVTSNTLASNNNTVSTALSCPPGSNTFYLFRITMGETTCGPCLQTFTYNISNAICQWPSETALITNECEDCLPGTVLTPEKKYVIGGWVKQEDHMPWVQVMERPAIELWGEGPDGLILLATVSAALGDPIVEGWQLIETEFEVPLGITEFEIRLKSLGGISYFDDIRLFPANGSMKCYVYDPVSLRFVSELDERHFATFYEYDEEGRLMRIKKETERGIMTIQESKSSTVKRPSLPE
jgi:hypothetical protein